MDGLNRLRIGSRLGLGFGAVLLLLCALTAVALLQMRALAANTGYYTQNLVPSYEALYEITGALSSMRRLEAQHLLASSAEEMDDLEKRIDGHKKALLDGVAHYEKELLSDAGDQRALEDVKNQAQAYFALWEQLRPLSRRGVEDAATMDKARKLLSGPSRSAYRKAESALQAWWSYNLTLSAQQGKASEATQSSARTLMLCGSAVALLLGVLAAVVISRSITQPLSSAVKAAEAVADGDLTYRIDARGKDETAQLLQALSRMNGRLADLVRQVRSGSDAIATGSREVAMGSTDLSQRTEKQAANLEETAASMEQLSATVKHNADTAHQASQMAAAASDAARQGGNAVEAVVATMQDISASSRRIEDITGVIDGIAFQTNILALNAAVEAARAGEQGRGFAVVAGEVRTLAQRSAEAAKEIKGLIADSVGKVQTGSQQVGDAGSVMQDLVRQVQRVSDLLGEISSASVEQTSGIDQVSQAVSQLDEVTQQNAALVEESTAAADSLSQQASRLAELVRTFRLDHEVPAYAAAPAPMASAASAPVERRPSPTLTAQAPQPRRSAPKAGSGSRAAIAPPPMAAAPAPASHGGDDGEWTSF
ncbi:methyl-accepting chemotaxis protein [Azohydromonas lata]|uniref:methyl-accepting chemotaxis protein n=1 Tax=Azohydromonas lata TaxID=45677 RepID=UPI000A05E625|nr:methyl-accepting chemotaxis protein [Azohydromonas lata]